MNTKEKIHGVTCLVFVFLMLSCASKTETHDHEHHTGEWQEMDEFHMIMAETFHPYKDSANLEPVKSRASELLAAADEWADAPLPEKVDNQEVRAKLQQLKSDASTLAGSVQSADDNVIADHLTKLHDTFHSLQEEWYNEDE